MAFEVSLHSNLFGAIEEDGHADDVILGCIDQPSTLAGVLFSYPHRRETIQLFLISRKPIEQDKIPVLIMFFLDLGVEYWLQFVPRYQRSFLVLDGFIHVLWKSALHTSLAQIIPDRQVDDVIPQIPGAAGKVLAQCTFTGTRRTWRDMRNSGGRNSERNLPKTKTNTGGSTGAIFCVYL